MCLTERYSRVRVGKNLSDMFPIRNGLIQGDALKPLLFNLALENDERYQLDVTILFIIIYDSICFGHLYTHLQEYRLYRARNM